MEQKRMFYFYAGTKSEFIAAGLATTYERKIVFIKGGPDGTGAAVFARGNYYGNIEEALASLKYFSKISAGGKVAQAAGPDGTITFTADDPASVDVKVDERGVHFALTQAFKEAVNTTLPGRIKAIEDDYLKAEDKTALEAAIAAAKTDAVSTGKVTIAESEGTGDVLKKYVFSQNGEEIGTINLAKDLVVSGGKVIEKEDVKYLQLTIANQETPVEIAVSDLVDVYKGSAYIDIASDNTVSVKFADLATALVAEGNAVGDKLKAITDKATEDKAALQSAIESKVAYGDYSAKVEELEDKNAELEAMFEWVDL